MKKKIRKFNKSVKEFKQNAHMLHEFEGEDTFDQLINMFEAINRRYRGMREEFANNIIEKVLK
jgi:hypothetical protein